MEVLVCVTAYNHEAYIEQCIHSIMSQKCVFDFKVIVFDDASIDRTREILNKLKVIYGEQLILYYPKSNMFSKGKCNYHWKKIVSMEKAKYIAFCEGDDYWCDNAKLQTQYEIMENNYDCSLCVHMVDLYDELKNNTNRIPNMKWLGIKGGKQQSDLLIKKQIEHGNIFSYNSYFWKSDAFYRADFDNIYWNVLLGDYTVFLFMALCGKIFVLEKCMAVKRVNNIGTLSYQANCSSDYNGEKRIGNLKQEIAVLKQYNEMSHEKYRVYIENAILCRQIKIRYLRNGMQWEAENINPYTGQVDRTKMQKRISHFYIKCCKHLYGNGKDEFAENTNKRLKKQAGKRGD